VASFLKKIILFVGYGFASLFFTLLGISLLLAFAFNDRSGAAAEGKSSKGRGVGVVSLEGEIFDISQFEKRVEGLVKNDNVKALVARIDSPGGSVGASEEAFRVLKWADSKKPVVCSLGNSAASGGLLAAMGCRKIISNRGTITGSIGVVLMTPFFGKIAEKVGAEFNVIKSGKFKDSGSPYRKMEEADKVLLQSIVDAAHKQFVSQVAEARGLSVEKVSEFADGRIILGELAKELGLVDGFGGMREAASLALKSAGVEGDPVIVRETPQEELLKIMKDKFGALSVLDWLGKGTGYRVLYHSSF